ncbi:hypothetical protein HDV05_006759 [Chytridiales sp. JEL 0842]|nr:hypothetical protein HDV05_006759 [Chytridiales sp. JEL 0842]
MSSFSSIPSPYRYAQRRTRQLSQILPSDEIFESLPDPKRRKKTDMKQRRPQPAHTHQHQEPDEETADITLRLPSPPPSSGPPPTAELMCLSTSASLSVGSPSLQLPTTTNDDISGFEPIDWQLSSPQPAKEVAKPSARRLHRAVALSPPPCDDDLYTPSASTVRAASKKKAPKSRKSKPQPRTKKSQPPSRPGTPTDDLLQETLRSAASAASSQHAAERYLPTPMSPVRQLDEVADDSTSVSTSSFVDVKRDLMCCGQKFTVAEYSEHSRVAHVEVGSYFSASSASSAFSKPAGTLNGNSINPTTMSAAENAANWYDMLLADNKKTQPTKSRKSSKAASSKTVAPPVSAKSSLDKFFELQPHSAPLSVIPDSPNRTTSALEVAIAMDHGISWEQGIQNAYYSASPALHQWRPVSAEVETLKQMKKQVVDAKSRGKNVGADEGSESSKPATGRGKGGRKVGKRSQKQSQTAAQLAFAVAQVSPSAESKISTTALKNAEFGDLMGVSLDMISKASPSPAPVPVTPIRNRRDSALSACSSAGGSVGSSGKRYRSGGSMRGMSKISKAEMAKVAAEALREIPHTKSRRSNRASLLVRTDDLDTRPMTPPISGTPAACHRGASNLSAARGPSNLGIPYTLVDNEELSQSTTCSPITSQIASSIHTPHTSPPSRADALSSSPCKNAADRYFLTESDTTLVEEVEVVISPTKSFSKLGSFTLPFTDEAVASTASYGLSDSPVAVSSLWGMEDLYNAESGSGNRSSSSTLLGFTSDSETVNGAGAHGSSTLAALTWCEEISATARVGFGKNGKSEVLGVHNESALATILAEETQMNAASSGNASHQHSLILGDASVDSIVSLKGDTQQMMGMGLGMDFGMDLLSPSDELADEGVEERVNNWIRRASIDGGAGSAFTRLEKSSTESSSSIQDFSPENQVGDAGGSKVEESPAEAFGDVEADWTSLIRVDACEDSTVAESANTPVLSEVNHSASNDTMLDMFMSHLVDLGHHAVVGDKDVQHGANASTDSALQDHSANDSILTNDMMVTMMLLDYAHTSIDGHATEPTEAATPAPEVKVDEPVFQTEEERRKAALAEALTTLTQATAAAAQEKMEESSLGLLSEEARGGARGASRRKGVAPAKAVVDIPSQVIETQPKSTIELACEVGGCDKVYTSKAGLRYHMVNHHANYRKEQARAAAKEQSRYNRKGRAPR